MSNATSIAPMPTSRDSKEYNMQHQCRGKALIINQFLFENPQMEIRHGSNKDRDDLEIQLGGLGFEVKVLDDAKQLEVLNEIDNLAREDHTHNDCVLIVVMTHGKDGILYASDTFYSIESLWSPFTADKCPSLAGKPKMFFIQACQGRNVDLGVTLGPGTRADGPSESSYMIPRHADFLIAYSTIPGFLSCRFETTGSWFIQALCSVLDERDDNEDLLSLLTTVSRRVAINYEGELEDGRPIKQIPCIASRLIRKIYFRQKISTE